VLDEMSLDLGLMFYEYGMEEQKREAQILVGVIAEALTSEDPDQTPDKKAFYREYGDKIK